MSKVFNRGFKNVEKAVNKTARYLASCDSCRFMYGEKFDKDNEFCHNTNVTDYDMIYEDTRTYCILWEN